jgi:hypothetical protein
MMTAFTATEKRSSLLNSASHGGAYGVKNLTASIELAAQATFPHTIDFGRIPSNARLMGSSMLYWDDLATATTTLDLGLGAVDGNLANADDPNCLSDGNDVTSASTGSVAITAFAEYGNEAWDFVASETVDPGGVLKVYATVADALTTGTGTITCSIDYVID